MHALPANATVGEKYNPIAQITTREEAAAYLESLVEWQMQHHGRPREMAESIERANIGYYSGYFSEETGKRVRQLFGTPHPVFG